MNQPLFRPGEDAARERGAGQNPAQQAYTGFSNFLWLERAARHAQTPEQLRFVMVNDSKRLFDYRQAALAFFVPPEAPKVEAVSGVAVLEREAPFLLWLHRAMRQVAGAEQGGNAHRVAPEELAEAERAEWSQWTAPHVLWLPLKNREERIIGALWIAKDKPWLDPEIVLAEKLADAYAHAWIALVGEGKALKPRRRLNWRHGVAVLALTLLAMAWPVRQSTLAPAEVVPEQPILVAAPLDGVIAQVLVEPNQAVRAGQELLRFDDTNLRSRRDVARRTLDVAQAELHRASQGAFNDRESSAQLALLRARLALRQAELDYAQALLDRVVVRAERDGVAVFSDKQQWIGRPVATGERIMLLADPDRSALRIDLPVGQAIRLAEGADVVLFLDNDPLNPLRGTLLRASYEAEPQPDGTLAYRLDAGLDPDARPRLGLRGTAKIYGEDVPLFMYLFRRPLSALRQWVGF